MWRSLKNGFFLSELVETDKRSLVSHLAEKEISDRTLTIPFPYTESDAEAFLELSKAMTREQGIPSPFAIREPGGGLVGVIGLEGSEGSPSAVLGFWLAKPYWNRGVMTAAVNKVVDVGFLECGLEQIVADVFLGNDSSERVLIKCGFEFQANLRKTKQGNPVEVKRYLKNSK